jgi:hypothetical protein
MILLGAYFYAWTFCHISRLSVGIFVPFMVHIGVPKQPQNVPKKHKKPVFWLLWTISLKIMAFMIGLGVYFYARTLSHTSSPLTGHLGTPKWTQKDIQRPVTGQKVWLNV